MYPRLGRGLSLTCLTAMCLGCGLSDPVASSRIIEWEVPGTTFIPPVVKDSLVVTLTEEGRLTARNRFTGQSVWTRSLPGAGRPEQMLLRGNILLVPAVYLFAIDIRNGRDIWVERGAGDAAGYAAPGIAGDTVFVPGFSGRDAMAIDLASGELLWRTQLGGTVYSPAVGSSLVVFSSRDFLAPLHELVALDRQTGAEVWRVVLPDSAGFQGGAAHAGVVVDDRLLVGTTIAEVMAIRLSDGAVLWRRFTGTARQGSGYLHRPLLLNDEVVFYRGDGVLESWDPATGAVNWSSSVGSLALSAPRECLPYLCLGNGRAWILDRRGQELWVFGGGSNGIGFISNVTVAEDGWMYAGVSVNNQREAIIALRPPVLAGATP